jgi:zinc/manganese transport system substrate-binding protein
LKIGFNCSHDINQDAKASIQKPTSRKITIKSVETILKKWIYLVPAILIIGSLLLAGCQPTTSTSQGKKSIVVTYSVLGSVVKALVGDQANVTISVPNGQDPHEWEPSAKDIETINKADLVIQNGLGLESGLQKTLDLAKSHGVRFFTASDHIIVRHVGQGEGIPSGDPDQAIGAADPHLWMDPLTLKDVVAALAMELKSDFNLDVSSQATAVASQLDSLNLEIANMATAIPVNERKLVTGHESMGYFAQRYNFKLVGVIIPSLTSQAEVSAADLAELKQTIQDNQVKAIFTELGTSAKVAQAIGNETGVKVVEITTHAVPADGSYFTFIRDICTIITDALK